MSEPYNWITHPPSSILVSLEDTPRPVKDVLYPLSTAQLFHLVHGGVGIVTSDHVGDDAEPVFDEFPFLRG